MNRAIFIFTCLLKLSSISKMDIALLSLAFFGFLAVAMAKHDVTSLFDVFRSPPILMAFAFRFAQDIAMNRESLRDGEYFALLFTRPITRASYVFTKAIVIALGAQVVSWLMILLLVMAQLIAHSQPVVFIDGWGFLSLAANCFGIGCLVILLRTMPAKVSYRCFFLIFSVYVFQSTMDFSVKPDFNMAGNFDQAAIPALKAWQALFSFFQDFLYPVLNIDAIAASTRFSWTAVVNYVSDCFLYLTLATYILNRREFSYAYD